MKKNVEYIVKLILLSILIFCSSLGCSGCVDFEPEYKVYGDFLYEVVHYNENGIEVIEEKGVRSAIRIMGLSEEGKQKEVIIIPEYIDGLRVEELGKSITFMGTEGVWEGNNTLEKIYIPFNILCNSSVFYQCQKLKKVIILQYDYNAYCERSGISTFITSLYYESTDIINSYTSGFGYLHFANVSYFYNYDDAPNDNYYWIDDYDYGEKISFIPPEPTRDGYTFGGWYKESECINKWNFEIDMLPEVKYTDVIPTHQLRNDETRDTDFRVYQETKLYAKWIEIEV